MSDPRTGPDHGRALTWIMSGLVGAAVVLSFLIGLALGSGA